MSLFIKELWNLRWRFIIMLAILLALSWLALTGYNTFIKMIDLTTLEDALKHSTTLTQYLNPQDMKVQISRMVRDIDFYIWSQWFAKNLYQTLVIATIVLAFPIFAGDTSRGTMLFLLSNQTRAKIFMTKVTACGLALWGLVTAGCIMPLLLAPYYHFHFGWLQFFQYWLAISLCSLLLYSLVVFWSVLFADVIKPIVFSIVSVIALGFIPAINGLKNLDFYRYLCGVDIYFKATLPWLPLAIILLLAILGLYASWWLFKAKDF